MVAKYTIYTKDGLCDYVRLRASLFGGNEIFVKTNIYKKMIIVKYKSQCLHFAFEQLSGVQLFLRFRMNFVRSMLKLTARFGKTARYGMMMLFDAK